MLSVRRTRLTLSAAERAFAAAGFEVVERELFLVRPEYTVRYGLDATAGGRPRQAAGAARGCRERRVLPPASEVSARPFASVRGMAELASRHRRGGGERPTRPRASDRRLLRTLAVADPVGRAPPTRRSFASSSVTQTGSRWPRSDPEVGTSSACSRAPGSRRSTCRTCISTTRGGTSPAMTSAS